jgi:hypothetical protein
MAQELRSSYTRSGARRAGDDYQDIIALSFFVEWLEHPDRFRCMKVEADESGFLDDVRAEKTDGTTVLRQVKFSTHPDEPADEWSWAALLTDREGKLDKTGNRRTLPSLLSKWGKSFEIISRGRGQIEAAVVSNRRAGPDLATSLADGLVDLDRISDPSVRAKIVSQLGGEPRAGAFFFAVHFELDHPSLDVIEKGLEHRFAALGGARQGWLNLQHELRRWVRHRNEPVPEGIITFEAIRAAAEWHRLRSLPQDFTVPADYVLPSRIFHHEILSMLGSIPKGCLVVEAGPAVGKSTYSSYLFQELRDKSVPTVRHHYFLSMNDRSPGRLEHERAAESLMHDLALAHAPALGKLAVENPQPEALDKWLESCGRYYSAQGKRLVVIVDGLDHVWRENRSVDALRRLFDYLLPAPAGVVVLVATQPVDDNKLPPALLRAVPRDQWRKLPPMDGAGVRRWLEFHRDELAKANGRALSDFDLDEIGLALFVKSGGHPLHLRYVLDTLLSNSRPVTAETIAKVPACSGGEIYGYYEELWRSLPTQGRMALLLVALCAWPWPRAGLVDCLELAGLSPSDAVDGRREIQHLLHEGALGLEPVHPSISAFVLQQRERDELGDRLLRAAQEWLRTDAPAYWRWAHEWLLAADLENKAPLLRGPNRAWLLQSLSLHRSHEETRNIMSRAAYYACELGDLPRAVELGALVEYLGRANNESETMTRILEAQLLLREDEYLLPALHAHLSELRVDDLRLVAELELRDGHQVEAENIYFEQVRRYNDSLNTERTRSSHQPESSLRQFLVTATMMGAREMERALDYVFQQTNPATRQWAIEVLAKACRDHRQQGAIRLLMKRLHSVPSNLASIAITAAKEAGVPQESPPTARDEFNKAVPPAVFLALEGGWQIDNRLLNATNSARIFTVLYSVLRGLPDHADDELELPTHDFALQRGTMYERRPFIAQRFHEAFFLMLTNHLRGKSPMNEEWLGRVSALQWPKRMLDQCNRTTLELAALLRTKRPVALGWIYEHLSAVPRPLWKSWSDDTGDTDYGNAAEEAIGETGLDILSLLPAVGLQPVVSAADLVAAKASGYWKLPLAWVQKLIDRRRAWLTDDALKFLIDEETKLTDSTVGHFDSRANDFAVMAVLSAMHAKNVQACALVRRAADNLVAHGSNKDKLLVSTLEAVRICHPVCSKEAGNDVSECLTWLRQVAPAIAAITEFTNGDETARLPQSLADVLAEVEPKWLITYHRWLTYLEKYDDAVEAFHCFLRTADLSDPANIGVAKTAVDKGSLRILEKRACGGDSGAKAALYSVLAYVGSHVLEPSWADERQFKGSEPDYERSEAPNPSAFPPERLRDFLDALKESRGLRSKEQLQGWINYWKGRGRSQDVLGTLKQLAIADPFFRNHDDLFDLACILDGPAEAYPFIVQAHREERGWLSYWTDEDAANHRFAIVKRYYPGCWLQFILDTLTTEARGGLTLTIPPEYWIRLVRFCILLNQPQMAKQLVGQMVLSACELVPAKLPNPSWLKDTLIT